MSSMSGMNGRRSALQAFGVALAGGAAGLMVQGAAAQGAGGEAAAAHGATTLTGLMQRLAAAPRRRDFKTVPMILDHPDQWDQQALAQVLAYKAVARQAWDNTDLGGSWLNAMRNSLNAQVWSFRHPDFLAVSVTHGAAQLALYDQATWDKYGLAKFAGKGFDTNTLILEQPAAKADPHDYENPMGVYSAANTSIPALQQRGVVFMACHNAIWELAGRLIGSGTNPDGLSIEALAAELTNHLIHGVVLTPGAVATFPELHRAGFSYAR